MGLGDARYRERHGTHASVAAVWTFAAGDASPSLIAADGCFDLIVSADGSGEVHAFVDEPGTRAFVAHVAPDTRLCGVRLRPGYGAALTEHRVELLRAVERSTDVAPDALEALVVAAVGAHAETPGVVVDFLGRARATRGCLRLTSDVTSSHERELQRACRRWLGMPPKSFLRIERAWAARAAIGEGTPLAAVAADLGYADQAHMTRDVHALLGLTPRELRAVGFLQDSFRPNR